MGLRNANHSECRKRWKGIQTFHMVNRGWADVAYSFAVCYHATILEGRGKGVRTAANGTNQGNNEWYAAFFMLGGREKPTSAMLLAAEWYGKDRLGITRWNLHSNHKATACPGEVSDYVGGGKFLIPDDSPQEPFFPDEPSTPSKPGTAWTESLVNNLPLVSRSHNSRGVWARRVQSLLAANGVRVSNTFNSQGYADGIIGPGSESAIKGFQRTRGLSNDGIVGKNTWTKLLGR